MLAQHDLMAQTKLDSLSNVSEKKAAKKVEESESSADEDSDSDTSDEEVVKKVVKTPVQGLGGLGVATPMHGLGGVGGAISDPMMANQLQL